MAKVSSSLYIYFLDYMRKPGIEPGSKPWEGFILPINYSRIKIK